MVRYRFLIVLIWVLALVFTSPVIAKTDRSKWPNWQQWPTTDFSKHVIPPSEFTAGGPAKDGIPAIDAPKFAPASQVNLHPREPVVLVEIDDVAKAYPVSVLMWHEIVNDTIAGHPVAVTFCPLCNAAIVFDRIVDGKTTSFGVTGLLRKSDLVMYDRASLSWWQQFSGRGLVGARAGDQLTRRPAQLISFAQYRDVFVDGPVLLAPNPDQRNYGRNPYINYDTTGRPIDVFVEPPKGFSKMERVVVVGDEAWRMSSIAKAKTVFAGDLRLKWQAGQASALDTSKIENGRDVGSVVVEKKDQQGHWQVVNYDVVFAFVFAAFKPDGTWHK